MADIVIAQGQPGTSFKGLWTPSGVVPGTLRADQNAGNSYRWTLTIVAEGDYDVFVRWGAYSARGSAVPFDVKDASGAVTRKTFDERINNQVWTLHGRYHFKPNDGSYVETIALSGEASADAIKLTPIALTPQVSYATEVELIFRAADGTARWTTTVKLPSDGSVQIPLPVVP